MCLQYLVKWNKYMLLAKTELDDRQEARETAYRVLIVDDNLCDQKLYRSGLDSCPEARFIIDCVDTGMLGLLLLASEPYDCVLLGSRLPDGHGATLVEKCRQVANDPDLAVVLLFDYGDEELVTQDLPSRASDCLHKPTVSSQLLYRSVTNAVIKARLGRTSRLRQNTIDKMNRELVQKNREIEAFYQSVSHELKTPLTAIREYTSLVIDGLAGEIPSKAEDFLAISLESTDHLARLVDDLFDTARIERGKLKLALENCCLVDIVSQALSLVEEVGRQSNIELQLNVADEIPRLMLDFDRVLQVFVNLLSNAIKFTEPGGWIVVTIGLDSNQSAATVSVRDNGCGISGEDLQQIFDKLYQSCEGDAINHSGIGVGLHLCRNIVSSHGGDIWVTSVVNEGSLFEFTLPISS